MNPIDEQANTPKSNWTFLSNHAHVLICIAENPFSRIRDLAFQINITERGVQQIIQDLELAGYLCHVREGRRNRYTVQMKKSLRHPVEKHCNVSDLFAMVLSGS
jgi:DNA-binding MarR family transcriptional regulator